MPRAFNEREKEVLRGRLIEAGKRGLNRLGMRNLRVEELAQEAGISKGSFYAFFPSKEEFVLSIFESWENQYRRELLDTVLAEKDDPRKALETLFVEAFAILDREPGLASLGFRDVNLLLERLPPERVEAHKANDARVMMEALEAWRGADIIALEDIPALEGVFDSIFILAMHREDFPQGSFGPAMRVMAEALALRLAKKR
jgi:AcrR family transcriptional regulator